MKAGRAKDMLRRAAGLALAALCALSVFDKGAAAADGDVLERVRERGALVCGLRGGVGGYSFADPQGHLDGFMVDFCRALAAATLGDARAIRVVRLPDKPQEFAAVLLGQVDVSFTTTTWTLSRDATVDIEYLTPLIYDGQGFAVWTDPPIPPPPLTLMGPQTVCVKSGTTTHRNLEDFIAANARPWEVRTFFTLDEAVQAFVARECGMLTTDRSVLITSLAGYRKAGLGIWIYPEVVSREPLTPYVARGDRQWSDIARWTLFAAIWADHAGLTAAAVRAGRTGQGAGPEDNGEAARALGGMSAAAAALRLSPDWVLQIIAQVGNYGEIFERNLGESSPYGMERGLNQPWSRGGLLYAPPFE